MGILWNATAFKSDYKTVKITLTTLKGNTYAFNLRTWNETTNVITYNLYFGATSGGAVTPLIPMDGVTDYNYMFTTTQSHLLFLSDRSGSVQLWGVSLKNKVVGTPYQISSFPVSIDNAKLNVDSSMIGFSAQIYPGLSMKETAAQDAAVAASRVNAQYWDKLFIRRWDTWWEGKYNHVFVAALSYNSGLSQWQIGTATDLMLNWASDCPSRPFGGSEEFSFSPDKKEIAFTSQVGDDIAWSTDLNVYIMQLSSLSYTCLTCSNTASDTMPSYSPDGKYLAYGAMVIPQYESDRLRVTLYDRTSKTFTTITEAWDGVSPSSLVWSTDSKYIYATGQYHARQQIFSILVPTGTVTTLISDHFNEGFEVLPCLDKPAATCFLFAMHSLTHPTEIYITSSSGSLTQLTSFNTEALSEIEFSDPIEYHFTGADGDDVQGWVFKPYGWVEGTQYPLVMYIHGGPEDSWLDEFHYRWNPQTIAGAGYAVFAVNPHGSSSFGDAFEQAILKEWGGKPYQDVMLGLDAVGTSFSWIDINNAGAMGASYGGFMINWLNSQTDRYKCLICHDGVFDPLSEYYYTDELYFDEMEFGGAPYIDRTYYDKWSPMAYAANMVTPQLTFHGGMDFRIPDVSGISAFTVLQRKGIPSVLIRFPDENHWVQDPNNSLYWHEQVLAWLQRWLLE